MVAWVLACVAAVDEPKPQQAMAEVQKQVRSLRSLSAVVELTSVGSPPQSGIYLLRWRGGRFDMIPQGPATASMPGYYSDGRTVVAVYPDGRRLQTSARVRDGFMAPWEESGGLLLSWLMNTFTARVLLQEPKQQKLPPDSILGAEDQVVQATQEWKFGDPTDWDGKQIQPVLLVRTGVSTETHTFMLNREEKSLLGVTREFEGAASLWRYRQLEANPRLPDSLGRAPGGQD